MNILEGELSVDMAVALRRKLQQHADDVKEIRDAGFLAKTTPSEVSIFRGMYRTLDKTYDKYESLYEQLCDIMDDTNSISIATQADHDQRKMVRREVQEAHSYMSSLDIVKDSFNLSDMTLNLSRTKAKLPALNLHKFYGERAKWPRFRDTFKSLVIDADDLRDIDRFHYLLAYLEGSAESVIAHVPVTDGNFNIAWTSLERNYDNKRILAATYLDSILEIPALTKKPTVDVLTDLIAKLSEVVAAFKTLNIPDPCEYIFFHLARRSLDPITKEAFEHANTTDFPKFDDLIKFLRSRCTASELAGSSNQASSKPINQHGDSSRQRYSSTGKMVLHTNNNSIPTDGKSNKPESSGIYRKDKASLSHSNNQAQCFICKGPHNIGTCYKFAQTPASERLKLLEGWKGCHNCLIGSHNTNSCKSRWCCRYCRRRHHSMLHFIPSSQSKNRKPFTNTKPKGESQSGTSNHVVLKPEVSAESVALNSITKATEVMLGTAMCRIKCSNGELQPIRIAIDSGSHFSFLTSECAERLGLEVKTCSLNIRGVGNTPLKGFKGRVACSLTPTLDTKPAIIANAIVVDKITSPLPGFTTPESLWESYSNYSLADPTFWITRPIDFLLGCDLFNEILTGPVITIEPNFPKLVGTIFGHVALGRVSDIYEAAYLCSLHARAAPSTESLQNELRRFWEMEEPVIPKQLDPEEVKCEEFFEQTFYRLPTGRYGVRLPFKDSNPVFGNSKNQAMRRLFHLESRLEKMPGLREKYNEFMYEYIRLGHMEIAKQPGKFIIPHHCVVKGQGENTKIRVVFDAAARTSLGSLNDALMVGPKLQRDISTILLNFRQPQYAFTVDCVKMYRQILLHPEDRPFQHILWRFSTMDAVEEYELITLSYGFSCAPYEALRVIKQLVKDEGASFPLAAVALEEDMYIDDIATGTSTLDSALELQRQIIHLLSKGEFTLSKWAANHPKLIPDLENQSREQSSCVQQPVSLEASDDESSIKILGLQWNPSSDVLSYRISSPSLECNKRSVLSAVAKMYDPLGYLGPSVLLAKELVQEAWKRKLDWDEPFPADLKQRWNLFIEQLPILAKVEIVRWIVPASTSYTILIFADASERAYCASAYIQTNSQFGPQVHLLLAKTKLAPVKVSTIPRLELCAALLAARLWQSIQPFCKRLKEFPKVYFFTDSMIVLTWLTTPSYKLKTFVANRVVTIRDITVGCSWKHVASRENPSDLGSRGLTPGELLNNKLWFHGPDWAAKEPREWPLRHSPTLASIPELKPSPKGIILLSTPETSRFISWLEKFSKLSTATRAFALFLRAIKILRKDPSRVKATNLTRNNISMSITTDEIQEATTTLVKIIQAHAFFEGKWKHKHTTMPKHLLALNPFFNEQGVLLVGGRLRHSQLDHPTKHPALLPAKSHFSKLIIKDYHEDLNHAGPSLVLAHIRTKYWILAARNEVKKFCKNCVTCRKMDAPSCQPLMGDLPSARFQEGHPFSHVGVDFAGPFLIKESLLRRASSSKAYLCLFICLSTRAMHLEVASSLSTAAFCAALERFIGRRGLPTQIFSDNGTNFVGAHRQLNELYSWLDDHSLEIQTYATNKRIKWSWSPPHGPTFGGAWERGVRSVKHLMRTVYGDNCMTFEELATLLIKIEAILNSRPLCPMSTDPNDYEVLTPGHLLIGCPLKALPEECVLNVKENRLNRWQMINAKSQHFWKRWRLEYLTSLQQRMKWRKNSYNLCVGDLVLLKEDNIPRLHWPRGRIIEVHPGADGIVRVATVQTSTSSFRRPANKLIPLFPEDAELDVEIADHERSSASSK